MKKQFYPRLFETEPKLSIGRDKEIIMKDPFIDDILKVGGKRSNEYISLDELKSIQKLSKSNYKDALSNFLLSKGYNVEEELSKANPIGPKIHWKEFWNYELEQHSERTKQYREQLTNNETSINIPDVVRDYFIEHEKEQDFLDFIKSTPSGESVAKIEYLLEFLEQIILNTEKIELRFRIPSVIDVTLSYKQQEEWLEDAIEYLKKYDEPKDIESIYHDKILKEKTLLGVMFMLKAAGLGRGEVLLAFLIKNTEVSGSGESYDLKINNTKYEIKEYVVGNDIDNNLDKAKVKAEIGPIRLGTGGKVTRFEFWENIQESLKIAKKLEKKYKDSLEEIVGDYFYKVWLNVIDDNLDNSKAVLAGVNGGELNKTRLMILKMFYILSHALTEEKIGDNEEEHFTTAILKGPNTSPKTILIEPIEKSNLDAGVKLEVKSSGDLSILINELRMIPYVKNPELFDNDLNDAPQQYFEHEGLDSFIVFRRQGIMICDASDFNVSHISQAGIYLIEKKLSEDKQSNNIAKRAYDAWKLKIEEIKKSNPEAYKELLSSIKMEDFITSELEKDVEQANLKKLEQKEKQRIREKEKRLQKKMEKNEAIKNEFYPSLNEKKNLIKGGKGDNLSPKDVNQSELKLGKKVEREHTSSTEIATEIALDHLAEDPHYYTKLDKAGLVDEAVLNTPTLFLKQEGDEYFYEKNNKHFYLFPVRNDYVLQFNGKNIFRGTLQNCKSKIIEILKGS